MNNYIIRNTFIDKMFNEAFSGKQKRPSKQFIYKFFFHIKFNRDKLKYLCIYDRMLGEKNRRLVRTMIQWLENRSDIAATGNIKTTKTEKGFRKKPKVFILSNTFSEILDCLSDLMGQVKYSSVFEKIGAFLPTFSQIESVFTTCGINLSKPKYGRSLSSCNTYSIDKNQRIYNTATKKQTNIFQIYADFFNVNLSQAYAKLYKMIY